MVLEGGRSRVRGGEHRGHGCWKGGLPAALGPSLTASGPHLLLSHADVKAALSAFRFWTCPFSAQIPQNKLFRIGNQQTVHQ